MLDCLKDQETQSRSEQSVNRHRHSGVFVGVVLLFKYLIEVNTLNLQDGNNIYFSKDTYITNNETLPVVCIRSNGCAICESNHE